MTKKTMNKKIKAYIDAKEELEAAKEKIDRLKSELLESDFQEEETEEYKISRRVTNRIILKEAIDKEEFMTEHPEATKLEIDMKFIQSNKEYFKFIENKKTEYLYLKLK